MSQVSAQHVDEILLVVYICKENISISSVNVTSVRLSLQLVSGAPCVWWMDCIIHQGNDGLIKLPCHVITVHHMWKIHMDTGCHVRRLHNPVHVYGTSSLGPAMSGANLHQIVSASTNYWDSRSMRESSNQHYL